ncbi:phosphate ABC transporter permease subunit PstC [Aestuariivirga litoralis]|uniref:Phosphate transport system permease protein n=1 Tax=Aestuariivirga litoralis TaxID=2650924 RepID=A0A2W2ASS8_9HYPH|nr:phosphate ABC transporter permease subunit PstC [Aestuariivirga litoralis]PZF76702.1 phosphate ABC transporter permease subunit PstC [Aestuariivirga litoralis]
MFVWTVLLIVLMAAIAYWAGRTRAAGLVTAGGPRLHSLPSYHGLFTAAGAMIGGLALAIAGALAFGGQSVATPVAAVVGAGIGAAPLYAKSSLDFRARNNFERIVLVLLICCSGVAILTTIGIVFSVLFETLVFFRSVSPIEFLFGTHWSPTGTPPSFGLIPLLAGTLLITVIAILVAGPLGLLSAIYMAEYASPHLRSVLKPILEILAGIPTVVLGFFAALTVAPLIRGSGEAMGFSVASESALAAGLVMGMMIVPLISSLSDDIINAVPQSLRDGSYAMGATKSETIKKVVLPAALPGIVSAFMLAISRAVGETMIVVMAAGLAANLTANPLAAVTTITVQIATLLVGDQEFDSPKTLSAFALGFVLFFFTLVLNYIALRIVQKYREQYD